MKIIILTLVYLLPIITFGTNLHEGYLKELKGIEKVEKRGNNKLFTLMRNTSIELSKDWSPELAEELAKVFNKLLDVNQNYFLVELLEPVLKKRKDEFQPILDKNLSPKNKKLYIKLKEMSERELKEGNG